MVTTIFTYTWITEMYCCRRPLKAFMGVAVLCMLYLALWFSKTIYGVTNACSDAQSIEYLNSVCFNYSKGIFTGSLCPALCDTREITFKKCLGHGVKKHVLLAEWNGDTVVLKTAKSFGSKRAIEALEGIVSYNIRKEDFKISTKDFAAHAERYIFYNQAGNIKVARTSEVTSNIIRECDVGSDDVLSYWELVACWELVILDEYVFYSLLHDNSAILNVYGSCGNMYAVEYAVATPFLGFLITPSDGRSWEFRSKLAVALLDMVVALENTPYGSLHLCDVQESNFGVVKRSDGTFVAKAIDVDMALFEQSLLSMFQHERNNTCNVDGDCFMLSCGSKCDTKTGKCAGIITSSNLVTLCNRMLKQRHRLHPALLRDPPENIREKLEALLTKCSLYDSSHIDINLINEIKKILETD